MKSQPKIQIPFSITAKLLLVVIPLLCIPVAIVGYLSYQASVESVTRLSREEQILQAKGAASEINNIFESCCRDLETISGLLSDVVPMKYHGQLELGKKETRQLIFKLFQDFKSRSPYYLQVRLIDTKGRELIHSGEESMHGQIPLGAHESPIREQNGNGVGNCHISAIMYSDFYKRFIVQFFKPLVRNSKAPAGELVIDLDYAKIIDRINTMRIGKHAFAFLVDQSGRTIVHPLFEPYRYDLSRYDDPLLREVVIDMILGETGWKTYKQIGVKAAAYAPVPATGWSLAVSIPIEEFKKEARAIRTQILQWVLGVLVLAGLGIAFYSYQLLKPVRHLVAATERIASGDLTQEIPVRSRDELGTLTESFNKMVRNLKETQSELIRSEKLISMGRLSAGVAHEVRNPLNAMKGAVALLQKSRSDDSLILEYSQLILREITRLNKFVTEFLYFAKQSSPNVAPTDVNEFLKNTLSLVEEEFRSKGVSLHTRFESSLPLINIDSHQMEQVLLNIFFNAMHAMPDGGQLDVSTSLKNDDTLKENGVKLIIRIEDDGVGIPEDHINNIFDPFFSTKETGTGLGLPISLGIVEGHGGKMEIASQERIGTTVTIVLSIDSISSWRL